MQMRTRKLLSFALSFMVAATFCFGGMGAAVAEAATETSSSLTTGEPVVLITGDGIIKDGKYSKDNVGLEKSYTLDELKEVTCGENITYSAINTKQTKRLYRASGVYVNSLLGDYFDASSQKLSFIADDGYTTSFDPSATYKNGSKNTTGFGEKRCYYPGLLSDSADNSEEVQTMIAWAYAYNDENKEDKTLEDPKTAGADKAGLRLVTGQIDINDQNNPLYNGDSKTFKVQVGEALTETAITIDGEDMTRADILLKDRAENVYEYTSSKGEQADTVRGVPLSVLLAGYGGNDTVTFNTADNYDKIAPSGMTKAELVENDYILAYEKKGKDDPALKGIYEIDKDNKSIYGFFTLYGNGEKGKPVKMINSISVTKANDPGDTPGTETETSLDKAAVTATDQTYTGKVLKPAVTVTLDGKTLTSGIDYTVEYSNNINVGTATITVTGTGNYTGTATGTFKINKAKQAITGIQASMTKTYRNKAFLLGAKAEGTLSYESSDEKVAAVSKDGKVTIKGPGKATITVKAAGNGNYEAAAAEKITITVNPEKAKVSKLASTKKGTLKVSWKKDSKASGYQVMIAKNKKFTQGKKTATIKKAKTTSKTFSKLAKGKKYYAKVRSYKTVNGQKIYGAWSGVKTKKVKK